MVSIILLIYQLCPSQQTCHS